MAAVPVNIWPIANDFRRVALALANSRGKTDDCVRGFYYAADLIASGHVMYAGEGHVNVVPPDGDAALGPNVNVTPYHEPYGRITIPRPRDLNILVRLVARLAFVVDAVKPVDYNVLSNIHIQNLIQSSLAIGALASAFTTTANYSAQFTGQSIQAWGWETQNPAHTNDLLHMGWLSIGLDTETSRPLMPILLQSALRLMCDACGFSKPADYLANRDWATKQPNLPGMQDAWLGGIAIGFGNWAYNWGNLLAVDRLLALRPLEWGICRHRPTCSFEGEIWRRGPLVQHGWFAHYGDKGYATVIADGNPYTVVPYGAYTVNVICQRFNWLGAPVLFANQAIPNQAAQVAWPPPAPIPQQPPYDGPSHTFWPCTIATYYPVLNLVAPICLTNDSMAGMGDIILSLSFIKQQPVPTAGLQGMTGAEPGRPIGAHIPRGIFARGVRAGQGASPPAPPNQLAGNNAAANNNSPHVAPFVPPPPLPGPNAGVVNAPPSPAADGAANNAAPGN